MCVYNTLVKKKKKRECHIYSNINNIVEGVIGLLIIHITISKNNTHINS